MSKHFQRDLDHLQREILALTENVEDGIQKAVRALHDLDIVLAAEVIRDDTGIDEEENLIEEECLKMLALHQPVAVDLRRVTSALLINTDLERMADLAENIAERVVALANLPRIPIPEDLQRMADLVIGMVRQAMDAFFHLDSERARRVCHLDGEVDRYNRNIIDELIQSMQDSPDMIQPGLSLFSVTRHLERIADHATSIAEGVVYLVEGTFIRHRPMVLAGTEQET
jgi:phosphate transport system protein